MSLVVFVKLAILLIGNRELSSIASRIEISIESNLAVIKRIALPENFNQQEEKEHIAWDLSQSLIEPVDQYAFFKTVNYFDCENYRDYLTIAIRKDIVR